MATVRELIVALGVETDEDTLASFEKKLDKAEQAMAEAAKKADLYQKELAQLGKPTAEQTKKLEELQAEQAAATKEAEKYAQKVEKARKKTETMESKVSTLGKGLSKMGEGFSMAARAAGAFFAGLAAGAATIAAAVKTTARYSEETVRMAASLGATTDKLQQFRFGFRALGASKDDLMDAFATVTDRAVDAAEGSKTYAREFRRIGIAVSELKGKKPTELLEMVFQKTKQLGDETQVVTSMVRLFGDDLGRRLMPALTGTAESFKELFQTAKKAGLILDERLIKSGQVAQIAFRKLEAVFLGVWRELGARLAPAFDELADMLVAFIMRIRESNKITNLLKKTVRLITGQLFKFAHMAESIYDTLGGLNGSLDAMKIILAGLVAAITGFFGFGVMQLFVGLKIVILSLAGVLGIATAKFLAIVAVVAAFALFLEDLWNYAVGNNSVLGNMAEDSVMLKPILDSLVVSFELLWKSLKMLWEATKTFFGMIVDILLLPIDALVSIYNLLAQIFDWEEIGGGRFTSALNFVIGLFSILLAGLNYVLSALVSFLALATQTISTIVSTLIMALKTSFQFFFDWMTGGFDEAVEKLEKRARKMVDFVKEKFSAIGDIISGDSAAQAEAGGAAQAATQRAAVSEATNNSTTNKTEINNNEIKVPPADDPEETGRRIQDGISERKQALSTVRSGER